MQSIMPPAIIMERWKQAIRLDKLTDWCALCDLILSVWARAECDCHGTEIAKDLRTLADVAFERARMVIEESESIALQEAA